MPSLRLKRLAARAARGLGRYEPRSAEESRVVQGDPIRFLGDVPHGGGDSRDQKPLLYARERPAIEHAVDMVYTDAGMAWVGGKLIERYSARRPRPQDLRFFTAPSPATGMDAACVVEAETPLSYGDFFAEHLATVANIGALPAPLLLPAFIGKRSYVQRDLRRMGVKFRVADEAVLVRHAHVLRKRRPHHNWRADEVSALRGRLSDPTIRATPGSIVYLSRAGEKSASIDRAYPNELVEAVLTRRGATIVRCGETDAAAFEALRAKADIVIADHGAALSNLIFWNPSVVIELTTTHWTNCFHLMANHMGVGRYGILDVRRIDAAAFEGKLDALLDELQSLAA